MRSIKMERKKKIKFGNYVPLVLFIICIFSLFIVYIYIYSNHTPKKSEKIRVLIVPGHEPLFGGTEFKNIKERDLAVELGNNLRKLLEADGKYEVFITRDNQTWSPTFTDYFTKDWKNIISWEKKSRKEYLDLIASGLETKPEPTIKHNGVSKNVAVCLYGTVKWANENNIDIVIHIHFNDDNAHPKNMMGQYRGFAIYIPPHKYTNGTESYLIAKSLFKYLIINNSSSNFPQESGGIIDGPQLIAIGANNTSSVTSILVEYGYIYESKFTNNKLRLESLKKLAEDTYFGLENYFNNK